MKSLCCARCEAMCQAHAGTFLWVSGWLSAIVSLMMPKWYLGFLYLAAGIWMIQISTRAEFIEVRE